MNAMPPISSRPGRAIPSFRAQAKDLRRSSVTRGRVALIATTAVVTLACGGGGDDRTPTQPSPQPPTQPTAPVAVPGTLTVRLVTPNPDDGAILLDIAGPAPAADIVAVPQGAVVHSRTNGNTTRVAVFGSLANGELLRFSVPDVKAAPQFTARLTEASDRASTLRTSVSGYQLTIMP